METSVAPKVGLHRLFLKQSLITEWSYIQVTFCRKHLTYIYTKQASFNLHNPIRKLWLY